MTGQVLGGAQGVGSLSVWERRRSFRDGSDRREWRDWSIGWERGVREVSRGRYLKERQGVLVVRTTRSPDPWTKGTDLTRKGSIGATKEGVYEVHKPVCT